MKFPSGKLRGITDLPDNLCCGGNRRLASKIAPQLP